MKIRLHPSATDEYRAEVSYYEQCEPGLGAEFAAEVEQRLALLVRTARAWPIWPGTPRELGIQRFQLERFPHAVAYRIEGETLRVYAIAAYKRAPGYWLSRVGRGQ